MKSTIELTTETFENLDYTFDWNDLPDEAKFVAVDNDGVVFWYGSKPELSINSWLFTFKSGDFIEDLGVVICNWKDTLTPRPQSDLVRTNTKVKKATSETVEYDESEIEVGSLWTPKGSTLFDGHVYMLVKTGSEFITVNLTVPGEYWSCGNTKKDALKNLVPFHGEVTLKG